MCTCITKILTNVYHLFVFYRVVGTAVVKPTRHAAGATQHVIVALSANIKTGRTTTKLAANTPLKATPRTIISLL